MASLVAVVLNWNGGEDTLRALESLAGIETICVDNGSADGSDREVKRRFPSVELIRTGANLGFAGGNNVGIRRALERGADWVLLLNNDAVADKGIAGALMRAAEARCPDDIHRLTTCVLKSGEVSLHPLEDGFEGRPMWSSSPVDESSVGGRPFHDGPWAVLVEDYNIINGRTWVLVLLTTVLAPLMFMRDTDAVSSRA